MTPPLRKSALPPWLDPVQLGASEVIKVKPHEIAVIPGGAAGLIDFLSRNRPWKATPPAYAVVPMDPSGLALYSREQFWLAAHLFADAALNRLTFEEQSIIWGRPDAARKLLRSALNWDPEMYDLFVRAARRNKSEWEWTFSATDFFGLRTEERPYLASPSRIRLPGGLEMLHRLEGLTVPDTSHLGPFGLLETAPMAMPPQPGASYSRGTGEEISLALAPSDADGSKGGSTDAGKGGAEADQAAPNRSKLVRRTPHLALPDGMLKPRVRFQIKVYADETAAAAGERSAELEIRFPEGQTALDLEVWLVTTAHFQIHGADTARITLQRDVATSSIAQFELEVIRPDEPGRPRLTAIFQRDTRVCGSVSREPGIEGETPAASLAALRPSLEIHPGAARPDLSVVIINPSGDGRRFECQVSTPLLAEYATARTGPWELTDTAAKIVAQHFALFVERGQSPAQRIANLRGAGRELFRVSPPIFKDVMWKLIDANPGSPLRTISVISNEPYIPWELMVPFRPADGGSLRNPLGVDYAIGRWVSIDNGMPAPSVSLEGAWVFAPAYLGPSPKPLKFAAAEAQFVATSFRGGLIRPANFDDLDRAVGGQPQPLLHFVCHGSSAAAGSQSVYCENNSTLASTALGGAATIPKGCAASRPFVFLNACEVGRLTPALVGVGGFAPAFIELGASAVVAPLWSVKDGIAHDVAMNFYNATLQDPARPLADVLREIRGRAYANGNGEDTYAAYCFYGDPLASRVPGGA